MSNQRRIGVHDIITSTNFYDYRLRNLGVAGGVKFWASPLTCVVELTTLAHYRACDIAMAAAVKCYVGHAIAAGGQWDESSDAL